MVTEDYVSFEVAKLLKEKGFDIDECEVHYDPLDHTQYDITLQMAMKWLRLKHELHIEPIPDCFDYKHGDIHDGWYCEITHLSDMSYDADYDSHKKHKTCEGACEDAIKFCLENLI